MHRTVGVHNGIYRLIKNINSYAVTKSTLFTLLPEHTSAVAALSVHASTKDITSTIFPALLAKENYVDLGNIALLTGCVEVYAQVVAILLDPSRFSAVSVH